LGIGDWGLGPIPNPQSPIPNPQSPFLKKLLKNYFTPFFVFENFKYVYKLRKNDKFFSKNLVAHIPKTW